MSVKTYGSASIDVSKLKKTNQMVEVLKRMSKNKSAIIGLIIFLIEVVIMIIGPWIVKYDYQAMDFGNMYAAPSAEHLLGCDEMGRDILTRLIIGSRYSIGLGLVSIVVSVFFGIILGSIAGYFGGQLDNIIMRFLDVFQAIPGIILNIAISAALGTGFINTVIALSIGRVPGTARMLRGQILNIRKMEYLEAADAINCSKFRTIVHHILPNTLSPLIVSSTMGIAGAIMAASGLSFIGLGIQPPTPEWGAMLSGSRNFIRDYPFMVIAPGVCIAITVLALNMLGDGLRDAMDPKLKD